MKPTHNSVESVTPNPANSINISTISGKTVHKQTQNSTQSTRQTTTKLIHTQNSIDIAQSQRQNRTKHMQQSAKSSNNLEDERRQLHRNSDVTLCDLEDDRSGGLRISDLCYGFQTSVRQNLAIVVLLLRVGERPSLKPVVKG